MRITSQTQLPTLPTTPARKKMTVLYFVDGKNNLSSMAEHSFKSLAEVGSDENVNIVAQLGLMKKDVLRGLVGHDGIQNPENLGKADMGNPETVRDFVEWGMKNFPAEKYMVVLWNHGAGFKGVLTDEEAHSICDNRELAAALERAQVNAGAKIDLLNFNACLMGQGEVAFEYRNAARYIVGSEEVEAGLRIPIPGLYGTTPQHKVLQGAMEVLKDAKEVYKTRGEISTEQLAKLFVYESKNQILSKMFTPTQSAIDSSKMEAVRASCEELAGQVLAACDQDPGLIDVIRSDVKKAQHYANIDAHLEPYVDYRDLGDFTKVLLKDDRIPASIKAAAAAAQSAVGTAVIAEAHAVTNGMVGNSMEGSTGMSVYLPTDYGHDKVGNNGVDGIPIGGTHGYEKTSWAENSNWEKMLKKISKDDDFLGKFPKLNRHLMSFGQISRMYGYNALWTAAKGGISNGLFGGWAMWPLQSFPYMIPIPGHVATAAGIVGGGLRAWSGVSKIAESINRTDSPAAARRTLAIDGAIDTAIGAGVAVGCGAMLAGVTNPALKLAAQASLALAAGRIAWGAGNGVVDYFQEKNKTVAEKLAEAETLKPNLVVMDAPPPPGKEKSAA